MLILELNWHLAEQYTRNTTNYDVTSQSLVLIITQPSIYGVIVYFLLFHESLNYSTGQ